jgi:hypothetical protein
VLEGGTNNGGGGGTGGESAGAQKFMSTGGGKTSTTGGQVYMGLTPQPAPGVLRDSVLTGSYGPDQMPKQPFLLSKQGAYDFFNGLSGKQLRDFINAGQVAGQLQDDAGFMEAQGLWKKLVNASAGLTAAGRKISPMDVLAGYLGKGPLGKSGGGQGAALWQVQYRGGRKFLVNTQTGQVKYEGPRFETTYQKTIDMTDPTTAKAIATSVFQQLMHRDPGNGELGSFAGALHTAEQNSPVVTNTTTEYDMNTGEPIGQSANSSGGFSADAKQYLAQQQVKKTKEYGAVQAATTYEGALENAIFNNPFGSV